MKPNIQVWQIDKIKPYDNNVKKHPADQVAKIAASIKEFGFDQPITVDKDGVIIKGHGRRLACISLGLSQVPVWVRDDLTPDQVRASRLADNRVAISDIDTEMFRAELASLDYDMGAFFDVKEIDFAIADLGKMNTDAFIDNPDAEVSAQEEQTKAMVETLQQRRVPLVKAFGFKDIQGSDEIYVARFMAQVEAQSGLKGDAALLSFIKGLVGELSHE